MLRLGVAAGATAAGARFDGFDTEVHEHHRVNAVAAEDAAQGWDVGVIATDGDADMAAIDGTSVGRIEAALSGRPMVALVFVLRLLLGALAVLRVCDEVRADRFLCAVLTLNFRRRGDGFL